MDTKVQHKGLTINLEMNDAPFELKGRGWCHVATLLTDCRTDDLSNLIGMELWGKKVLGVERFATPHQLKGWKISLLVKDKLW